MHIVQLLQRLKQRVKRHARTDIRHERDLFISSLRCQTQLSKLRDHLCRHIVDAVKAEVFQIGRGPALSCAGHTGNDNKLHSLLLLPDPNLRLELDTGCLPYA